MEVLGKRKLGLDRDVYDANLTVSVDLGRGVTFTTVNGYRRVQGNLDPLALLAGGEALDGAIMRVLRLIGDFSVEAHVLSALWVNLVGHKFDACLSSRALASRVRRYRADKDRKWVGDYHLESLGSFEPYFEPYRKWRDDGLDAMRDAIKREQPIIAMTLDVGNFYHSIDPSFLVDARFLEYLGVELTPFELAFSQLISAALSEWSARCRERLSALGCPIDARQHGGIPIGLSVVRG